MAVQKSAGLGRIRKRKKGDLEVEQPLTQWCQHHSEAHCLGMSYYINFLGGLGSNEFHIK